MTVKNKNREGRRAFCLTVNNILKIHLFISQVAFSNVHVFSFITEIQKPFFPGGAVAQEVEQSLTNWKVGGLIPGNCSLHVVVSLGKKLKPKLLLVALQLVYACL